MRFIKFKNGDYEEKFKIDFGYIEDGKVTVHVWNTWNYFRHKLKVHFRPERTWDDHMGNTPCGYYVNLPLPFNCGVKRVYI